MIRPLLIALLLQSAFVPPPRTAIENPAVVSPVPQKIQKDYDRLWQRFIQGNDDVKAARDTGKILRKHPDVAALTILDAYLDLYAGRTRDGEAKLQRVLAANPSNRIALAYLADLAFDRQEYSRASDLYSRLLSADPSRTDVETKREKAMLLGMQNLIRAAAEAEREKRFAGAESFYAEALQMSPREPSLHSRLADLFAKQKKWAQALEEYQKAREFGAPADDMDRSIAESLANLGRTEEARAIVERLKNSGTRDEILEAKLNELEDIGRWGQDIGAFRSIQTAPALSRAQAAALIVRYFPQLTEFRQAAQVATDIQSSWARPEIQTVMATGLMEPLPNHMFQPDAAITRGELAAVLIRLIKLLSLSTTPAPPIPITDVDSSNARYDEIQSVLNSGLMSLDDQGRFNPNGTVPGEEAVHAITHILHLTRG